MATLELADKLRERAGVTYEEAKEALEASGDDLLDAFIYLEKQGKTVSAQGGFYSSDATQPEPEPPDADPKKRKKSDKAEREQKEHKEEREQFNKNMKKLGDNILKIIKMANENFLDAMKNGKTLFSLPVSVVVLLAIFLFWVTVPLFVVSLFFGFRYKFSGAELGRSEVNRVMDSASDFADGVKSSFESDENKE
ncbi:MAG: ubiquitin [Oscillospiraceae bacterium]|jgi:DNA-binding transcriptional MerR regulator|nr:ubiquitin [Oscillospiraceae bacterium]